MLSERQIQQRRNAGSVAAKVLKEKYGDDYFYQLGKQGGRPTWEQALENARQHEQEMIKRRARGGRPTKESADKDSRQRPGHERTQITSKEEAVL